MLDPCLGCWCRGLPKKQDCLKPYPRLRDISNSRTGFASVVYTHDWSEAEKDFYNKQIRRRLGHAVLFKAT